MGYSSDSNESSARDLVTRLINLIGARDEKGVVPFVSAWPRIVGTDLAAHTRVLDIRNGAVLVGVDHPGWLQRMHLEQKRIIAEIGRQFPSLDVRYLHFSVLSPGELDLPVPEREPRPDASDAPSAPEAPAGGTSPETPAGSVPGTAGGTAAAREDEEFQRHLKGLEEALRRKKER